MRPTRPTRPASWAPFALTLFALAGCQPGTGPGLSSSGALPAARPGVLQACETLLDVQQDAPAAAQHVRSLMFIERFLRDVETRMDSMDPR